MQTEQHCRKSDVKTGIVAISVISFLIATIIILPPLHFIHFYIRLYILLEGSLQVASHSSYGGIVHAWSQEIGGFNEKKLSAN